MLPDLIQKLRKFYGPVAAPPAKTAFALVLWEKVAYLATDAKRAAALASLSERIGLTPEKILAAKPATLTEIATLGGAVEARGRRGARPRRSHARVGRNSDRRI